MEFPSPYIMLFAFSIIFKQKNSCLGDTVVYGSGMATVIIEANDDPNGIFSLERTDKAVEEGKTNDFL